MLERFDNLLMLLGVTAVVVLGVLCIAVRAHTRESHPHLTQFPSGRIEAYGLVPHIADGFAK